MSSSQLSKVLRRLRHIMGDEGAPDETDGQLLQRFISHHDESAFRVLLDRYGPMVMGVCRRALTDPHDADDAFQATFLVLVRKAASIQGQELVGNWLYGVAFRVARRARSTLARRGLQRAEVPDMAIPGLQSETDSQEVRLLLDEELQRLPRKYRVPMVLCYLEGQTNEATARYLRCPAGTLKTRLAKGRELLRARLERRGLALSAGALGALLAPEAVRAGVAPALADATLHAAALYTAGTGAGVSAPVASLMEGALREMFVAKLETIAGVLLLLSVIGAGAGFLTYQALTSAKPVVAADDPSVGDLPAFQGEDGGLAISVDQRIREWEPLPQERRFDEIGWANSLAEARRLAAQHGRPIFLLTVTESIATGRCRASAFNVRAGALSNDAVIGLLNRSFVPVYLSSLDYCEAGKAAAVAKTEIEPLRQEASRRNLPSRINQAWVLDADGRLLNTLDACHAPADQLMKFLVELLEPLASEPTDSAAKPVVAPAPQSRPPQANRDALVLHLTARYLERRGDELVPMRVALGKEVNYFMKGPPAEDWIVLERTEWARLLPAETATVGRSWALDSEVANRMFRHMYPPTEDNDLAKNRIDEAKLTATIVAMEGGVARARIEGALRMKHRFDPEKDDNRFVNATLLGYLDFEPARSRICSFRLITTEGTYGKNPIGVAVRSVPR
ncbi:hypothetical protein AYO44_11040 [Planctomycetaceae bacterium SCGC AG-212-F19]|nr:hypothetical protein AYO44_11040 [Planctomycetaceae bacterium SCGC AG-212-F19]